MTPQRIMASPSDESLPKRRKVRKGTHSCWECRRRKVKCIFKSPQDATCITCHRRGTECASQRDFEDPNTSSHPTRAAVEVDGHGEPPISQGSTTSQLGFQDANGLRTPSTCISESPTPGLTRHAGSFRLNCNARLSEQSQEQCRASVLPSAITPNAHTAITQALLRALPSQEDIKLLEGKITKVPLLCYQSLFGNRMNAEGNPTEQVPVPNLLCPEDHPILLASQMLLFSVSLQCLVPNSVPPGLSKHPNVIMEELAESAIKMVNSNDALLGTLEGLENIILEGMYHVDRGNIRRAWITLRRGVTVAQLLGLDLPGHFRFKLVNSHSGLDPRTMWGCIIWMERLLSLLLGLPSSTHGINFTAQEAPITSLEACALPPTLTDLVAKILERNQIRNLQKSLALTKEVDQELVSAAAQMPSKFWRPPAFSGIKPDSEEAFFETKRILEQIRYYTLVNQLHLPFMLCTSTSQESTCSKIACVNASREILIRQIAIRTFRPVSACLRMGDFLALIAGLTLVLSHIFSHCQKELDNALIHQRQGDRAIMEQALECMESMCELGDDVLAAKCGLLLKDLLAVEADAASQGNSYSAQNIQVTSGDDDGNGCQVLTVHVPYVGAIKITRKGSISITPVQRMSQDQNAYEGVTIGGIGSVRLDNSTLPSPSGNNSGLDESTVPTAAACVLESTLPLTKLDAQIISGERFVQQDQMFPDAAAPMDDWVFQGFDTAFFDVLMRGAADQELDGS